MTYEHDTLEHHNKERPGTAFRDLSEVPLSVIGKYIKGETSNCTEAQPEHDAISFYMLNHAMAEISQQYEPDEPLGDAAQVVEYYHQLLSVAGARLFNYLMIITTRESRHYPNSSNWGNGGRQMLMEKHGEECVKFTEKVKAYSQDALFGTDIDLPVGKYLDYLCDVYDLMTWSGSFGGKEWGKVTRPLRDVVHGATSIEMMLDVGFTLAHNNGPIFNKGFQYKHYDAQQMEKILDVQRGGQIPNLVRSKASHFVQDAHVQLLDLIENAGIMEVNPWVNWTLVEMLGAVKDGGYPHEKASEEQKFGNNLKFQAEMNSLTAKVQLKKDQQAAAQAKAEAMYIEIMPGVKLKKAEAVRV